jgi:hypothetical protein
MDLESLISSACRSPQMDEHQTGSCSSIWTVGFCFDGISRNIQQYTPETRLSNISRLFRTCPGMLKNKITKTCSNFIFLAPAHRTQNA